MKIRSYRNLWLVIISAKKMVVFGRCTIKFRQTPDSFWHTGKQNQMSAKDCSQQYYKLWNVHLTTFWHIHSHLSVMQTIQFTQHWELSAFYFPPLIRFVPINIYQVMFDIQINTCVDTNWSLLFSDFNPNLNLSTYVMKIHFAVV
jgi:hypothetical protein